MLMAWSVNPRPQGGVLTTNEKAHVTLTALLTIQRNDRDNHNKKQNTWQAHNQRHAQQKWKDEPMDQDRRGWRTMKLAHKQTLNAGRINLPSQPK
jgi:hypothetical protein